MEEKKNEKAKTEEKKVKEVKPKETKKEVKEPKKKEVKKKTKTEPKPEVKIEPKTETKPEVKVEPKVEPKTEVKVEPEAKAEAKPKFQKIEQPRPKKGKKRAVLFFLLVIIIGAVAVAWIYVPEFRSFFNVNTNTTTNTVETNDISKAEEWEKAYIKILVEENNYEDALNCKVQLINVLESDKIPALLVTYTKSDENILDIWQVDKDGQIETKKDNISVSGDGIKVLYDVEKEEYNWYSYYKKDDTEMYRRLSRLIMPRVNSYKKLEEVDYTISSKEDVGNITREKFEQKVIEVDSKSLNKTWVDFANNISKSEALKILESEYKKKRTAREVVKDSAKEDILDKAEEIQEKLNEPIKLDEETTTDTTTKTEPTETTRTTTETPETNASDTQETTTENSKTDIGKDEAQKLLEKKFGTNADGKKMGYYYLAWVKDDKDNKYYAFQMSWLVDGHYSFVDTILVSADGKTYKEIGTPEDFTDGQTVTKFDSEKSF